MSKLIYLIEKNVHGAWVIYGEIGVKQYYFYTKKNAVSRYIDQCKQTIITNIKRRLPR